jgi:tRNA modification GTPase
LNGVIDLSQAEAVADLIEAQTVRELRLANLNLEGGLRRTATDLRDALVEELARIEATIDFSEEIGDYNFEAGAESFKSIFERTELLLRRGRTAHRTRQGVRVAIVGRPNAGKSSLLNAMIGINRAIVTDQPGTTRDTIEETVDWNGLRVILIDTAGLRDATDQIERLGITRTLDETRRADEVLYVYDAVVGWTDEDERVLSMIDRHVTVVGNKADLADPSLGLKVSALYDNGLTEVIESITERYCAEEFAPTNERQSAHIELASRAVEGAWKASNTCQPIELVGVLVKEAIDQLGLVVGFTASEDMLEGIFSRFCIGK